MKLSARNQLPAKVTGITRGEATANIELDVNGQRLVSSITVEAGRTRPQRGHQRHGRDQGVRRDPRRGLRVSARARRPAPGGSGP